MLSLLLIFLILFVFLVVFSWIWSYWRDNCPFWDDISSGWVEKAHLGGWTTWHWYPPSGSIITSTQRWVVVGFSVHWLYRSGGPPVNTARLIPGIILHPSWKGIPALRGQELEPCLCVPRHSVFPLSTVTRLVLAYHPFFLPPFGGYFGAVGGLSATVPGLLLADFSMKGQFCKCSVQIPSLFTT